MALTYDGLKSAARANHPDWSEETVERWVQSQMNSATEQDRERWTVEWYDQFVKDSKWPEWIINHMSWNATQMWQDISDWSRDLISDEEAEAWWRWWKTKDQAAEIWWDILWWIVRTVWSTPSFIRDVWWLAFWSSKWWYDTTKQRANELQDQWVWR